MKVRSLFTLATGLLWNWAQADAQPRPIIGSLESSRPILDFPGNSKYTSPNPIARLYPGNVTGVLNGTLVVVPIPYKLAREIIPSKYGILNESYQQLLPKLSAGKYPLVVRIMVDHDIRYGGVAGLIQDFQSVHFSFPFVDLLGDGYSHFSYEKYLVLTYSNQIARAGAVAYGLYPASARFEPQDEAYDFTSPGRRVKLGTTFVNAFIPDTYYMEPFFTSRFSPLSEIRPWPFSFYQNVTNQPVFSDSHHCDQMITLYNTSISTGNNAPVGVEGSISIVEPFLPRDSKFKNVYGIKVASAFIENNLLSCQNLKGYAGP